MRVNQYLAELLVQSSNTALNSHPGIPLESLVAPCSNVYVGLLEVLCPLKVLLRVSQTS